MLVAIGHEANVGKDRFAQFIFDHLRNNTRNLKMEREGFADALYDVCTRTYGWAGFKDRHYYEQHRDEKEKVLPLVGKSPRQLLIGVGNILREFDIEIWSRPVLQGPHYGGLKIITDMRKIHEFERALELGAYLIRIKRPGIESMLDSDVDLRPFASKWHMTVNNDGTLNDLHASAGVICDMILLPQINKERADAGV